MSKSAAQILRELSIEEGLRKNWDAWWDDLYEFCLPMKANVNTKETSGTKHKLTRVYDNTAIDCVVIFAAGLMGYFTNPATRWCKLRAGEKKLNEIPAVQRFFRDAEDKLFDVLLQSNFYQELAELYADLGVAGSSAFHTDEDEKDHVRYYCRPPKEIYFREDASGRVVEVYRVFEYDALQAYLRFKGNAGKNVVDAYTAGKYSDKFEFVHNIGMREVYDSSKKDRLNKPVFSIWVNKAEKKKVDEGGYEEFPTNVVRFRTRSGEKWGYSPAMDAEAMIRGAQEIKKTMLRAGAKAVDPALELPHDGYVLPIDLDPGGINYKVRALGTGASQERILPIESGVNLPAGETMLEKEQAAIRRAFFADLFLLLANRSADMTAREVAERVEEKMLILGPAIGRIQTQLLSPTITRTFNILLRRGVFGALPPELNGKKVVPEYVGFLAKAQKAAEANSVIGFLNFGKGLSEIFPEVRDIINGDRTLKYMAEITNIDPNLQNDDKEIKDIRDARAADMERQAKLAETQAAAGIVQTGAAGIKSLADAGKAGGGPKQ